MSEQDPFLQSLKNEVEQRTLSEKTAKTIESFYTSYREATDKVFSSADRTKIFLTFLDLLKEQITSPYVFPPYHERITSPFNYFQFGLDFLRALIDYEKSSLRGIDNLREIASSIVQGDNVILLANHQIEADPQMISLMLEKEFPRLAEEMIFVAGERVLTDPLAIPFSMGCNLLCIYSKRYIDHPPEKKESKQLHNKKTMQLMSELLTKGGKCIYVAPSGGRDRPNERGVVEVAPFDPQSIEMFYLMAKKAKRKTHFFPLSLFTYDLLPPPSTVQVELGEKRKTARAGIHLSFGKQIDMDKFPGAPSRDKRLLRKMRAEYIWQCVDKAYQEIISGGKS